MNRRAFAREASVRLAALSAAVSSRRFAAALGEPPRVDGARLNAHLAALAEYGKNPQGGVSRVAYSDADRQGREYVMALMREARLEVTIDAAGNIVGRRAGRAERGGGHRAPIVIGSHIDSVPEGGNYDGDVGSLGAIEVAQTLAEHGIRLRHPLEVIVFQNEEGGLIGSSALVAALTPATLDLVSRSGKTIRDGIRFIGGDPSRLAAVRRAPGDITAYLELHIEQGGILDRERVDIGVVEGIVGINQWDVTATGFANHAGTTPMDQRRDALLATARYVEAVNRVVRSMPGRQVGTVGRIQAFPGAPNVVPGKVVFTLELRDLNAETIASLFRQIRAEGERIGAATGVTFSYVRITENVPALTDPRLQRLITRSAHELRLTTRSMPSGAGHDAQDMARLGPIGMIFIPSVGGVSHAPTEHSRPADIAHGADVLLRTVVQVDAW